MRGRHFPGGVYWRMTHMKLATVVFTLTLAQGVSLVAYAQAPDVLELSVSGVRNSPFPTIQGDHRRDFVFAALRGGWVRARGPTSLTYIVDLVPVAVSTNNTYRYDTLSCGRTCLLRVPRGRTAVGAGLIPFGLQMAHHVSRAIGVTFEGTAGAIWFDRNFPDPNARRLNFALGAAGAATFAVSAHSALSIGLLHHHLSNAGTAKANPGVNAWMLRVGYVHRRDAT